MERGVTACGWESCSALRGIIEIILDRKSVSGGNAAEYSKKRCNFIVFNWLTPKLTGEHFWAFLRYADF
jgi:hypothetical protein